MLLKMSPSPSPFISYHRPSISDEEISEVVATLRSGWLTTGPRTAQFEREFRDYVQAPHALAVNSGTSAMHLALAALGIGPGDEVITTPLTFSATVNVIIQLGATPVLADVGHDGNIDPDAISACINERTRAIMPVHLMGLPCRMYEIWRLAREHKLFVIEDAAHAVGAHIGGVPIGGALTGGNRSDVVAFSFYATKNLTSGEGGMVTTHRAELDEEMRLLCLHGISKDAWNRYSDQGEWFYEVVRCGFKYNLSDVQSAIGLAQLRKQEKLHRVRASYAEIYNEAFADVSEVETPHIDPECRHAWHIYGIRLRLEQLELDRAEFIRELKRNGIGTSVHFIPIPLHPYYRAMFSDGKTCPRALELYPRLVSLPLYPEMTPEQVTYVADQVKATVSRYGKNVMVAS
jgi:dTDP-4-amino-4,6-dideoxygalactose transaminase